MKDLKFSVHSLLSESSDGTINAPMSPMLFAKEIAQTMGHGINRLARIWFDDEKIHQVFEDGGLTGHDTLIVGCQYANDLLLSLWVDAGIGGIPVALCYQSDRKIIVSPAYTPERFAESLSGQQIQEIFDYIFNNLGVIAIVKPPSLSRKPSKT